MDGYVEANFPRRTFIDTDNLEPILNNIVSSCRQLRSLCISLKGWWQDYTDLNMTPGLHLIDAFQRSPHLRDLRVEIPYRSCFKTAIDKSTVNHPREAPTTWMPQISLWRSLDSGEPVMQNRSLERYPFPPWVLGDGNEESAGYWVL